MKCIDEKLEKLCIQEPKRPRKVVITLKEESKNLKPIDIGLSQAKELKGIPGAFAGTFTGEELIKISKRKEIQEIIEDFEVEATSK